MVSLRQPAPIQQQRGVIYVRVSKQDQEDEGTSLDTQEALCRKYAAAQGISVDRVYVEVFTGVELWHRPQLTILRDEIRRHEYDVLIAYAIDRLARDPVHLGVVVSEAENAGCDVQFVTEPMDNTPEGQLIRFVRGYAAKVEHVKIRERTYRGLRARVDGGKIQPGPRPLYGYSWIDGPGADTNRSQKRIAYVVNSETAAVVRRIFADCIARVPLHRITSNLTAAQIPSPTGLPHWTKGTVHKLLHHPSYKGECMGWRFKGVKVNGKLQVSRKATDEWIALPENTIPPIVDVETWDAAQRILVENKERASRNNRHPEDHLLRGGYAVCGHCDGNMIAGRQRGKPRYLCQRAMGETGACGRPTNTIDGAELDGAIWSRLAATMERPEIIGAELARMLESDPTTADLQATERALSEIVRKQANLSRRVATIDDDEAAAPMLAELSSLSSQKRQLEAERSTIQGRRETWLAAQTSIADLQDWCRQVARKVEGMTYEHKRIALDAFRVRVVVYRNGHHPRWELSALPFDSPVVSPNLPGCRHNTTRLLRWTDATP